MYGTTFMSKTNRAPKIELGDLIEATTLSVQRALQGRNTKWPFGPITVGIIFNPAAEFAGIRAEALSKQIK